MKSLSHKLNIVLELFINGTFALVFSVAKAKRLPPFVTDELANLLIQIGTYAAPIVILLVVFTNYINSKNFEEFLRKYLFSFIVLVPLLLTWGDQEFAFMLATAHLLSSILTLYDRGTQELSTETSLLQNNFIERIINKPAQLVFLSFIAVIVLGTFLLMLPISSSTDDPISFIDAFFTATSATCVTGLTTLSLVDNFSLFGQIIILLLIQIGGLSIMTLYSSATILLGKAMGMRNRVIMQDLLDVSSLEDLYAMIVSIIKYTFFIELWGAVILTIAFTFEGFEFATAIYYGFFHSISAFCNAGFSLFNNSLESYATNPLINFTIMTLITLGGLGFIALKELKEVVTSGRRLVRLGLHTKIVLSTSIILTGLGTLFIFFGEFLNSLDGYSLFDKLQISLFQSVTLRTAGFNTVPLTNLHSYTVYAMTLFMFIGGSPGSTAGGVKTTTLAVLIQSIVSTLKGKKVVDIFDRRIPGPIVVKATALTFISILITSMFILILMKIEPDQPFLTIFFEVISSSGTVGLSLGITPFLTYAGKIFISLLMFIGRIGPLTLVLAIGQQKFLGDYRYPDGRLMIG